MKIGIPKEIHANERRVACTPDETAKLINLGYEVLLEHEAGAAAGFSDSDYQQCGATIVAETAMLWQQSELICKVRQPEQNHSLGQHEATLLSANKTLISFFWPAQNAKLLKQIAAQGATALAMDAVPRIARAQKMDALSSMANIAGYRAVLEATQHFERFLAGQITAAGKVSPAKVLVIGAGVAGLSAISTAVRLGAIVRAFDTRPEVKEQINSLNATFLELDFIEEGHGHGGYAKSMSEQYIAAEMVLFAKQSREVDIIISTALIPGKAAPKLITADMVKLMKNGSVIVDLAAEQGGNCELTEADAVVKRHGVSIIGYTDLPSRMATQSSQLYAANIRHLITELTPQKDGELVVNMDEQVIRETTVVHNGKITWQPKATARTHPQPTVTAPKPTATTAKPDRVAYRGWMTTGGIAVGAAAILAVGAVAPQTFMNHFIVFVLACFTGWQIVWRVTPSLHTPLMSVTNAISSIIVIGAILQSNSPHWHYLALLALFLVSINIAGGFLVTHRMLKMFKK